MESVETVIIGGGQAGLAMSCYLAQMGHEHIVLERDRIAERWRTERWDSLRFQGPNWAITLPGKRYSGADPNGFAHKDEIVTFIEDYSRLINAPVITGVNVNRLIVADRFGRYELMTSQGRISTQNVVVATGPYQRPRMPDYAAGVPASITQIHSSQYRNADFLPDGAVLVVGSGASGCQIAEDLLGSKPDVYLSVGRHTRVPRRYRGRDVFWWRKALGLLDLTIDAPRNFRQFTAPLITGAGGGHDIDLREYGREGMTLLGRLLDVSDREIILASDLEDNLQRGDASFIDFKHAVDVYLRSMHLDQQRTDEEGYNMLGNQRFEPLLINKLNLRDANIESIVWATGYSEAFEWIDLPVFDAYGIPIHRRGVTSLPGLYFLGRPWQYKATSSFLCGVAEDAEYLSTVICGRN